MSILYKFLLTTSQLGGYSTLSIMWWHGVHSVLEGDAPI